MLRLAALLAVLLQPYTDIAEDRVDLIEVNHFYDEHGAHVFNQAIFWEWKDDRYVVQAWRMLKRPSQVVVRDGEGWSMTWAEKMPRKVWSRNFRETFTQYDPELLDRDYWPMDMRRELRE